MTDTTFYTCAVERVNGSDALRPYADVILYDWPEGDEHWRWVNAATEAALIDWAEAVRQSGTETLTLTEAAERLGVDTSTLRRRFEQGQYDAHKSGGTWLVEWPMKGPPKPKPRKPVE